MYCSSVQFNLFNSSQRKSQWKGSVKNESWSPAHVLCRIVFRTQCSDTLYSNTVAMIFFRNYTDKTFEMWPTAIFKHKQTAVHGILAECPFCNSQRVNVMHSTWRSDWGKSQHSSSGDSFQPRPVSHHHWKHLFHRNDIQDLHALVLLL